MQRYRALLLLCIMNNIECSNKASKVLHKTIFTTIVCGICFVATFKSTKTMNNPCRIPGKWGFYLSRYRRK